MKHARGRRNLTARARSIKLEGVNERMKERWRFGTFDDSEKRRIGYYRMRQTLSWNIYIRLAGRHYKPCDKCQEKLDAAIMSWDPFLESRSFLVQVHDTILCAGCLMAISKLVQNADSIIIGNEDYEPIIEMSRKWTDDDGTFIELTKNEYDAQKH